MVKEPPPVETSANTVLILEPATNNPAFPDNSFDGFGFMFKTSGSTQSPQVCNGTLMAMFNLHSFQRFRNNHQKISLKDAK